MASSSSSPTLPVLSSESWSYDVFLSFRGDDTRKNFVDHLYTALDQQGIHTYKDDETLPRGKSISPSLLKAIEESQIAVIIFSQNYANSKWCLDELTHIMKDREERKQIVMPIFYDVKPTEVRQQKRKYKEAFDRHELENKNKIETWGQAVWNDPWGWFSAPLEENRKYREVAAKQELENKEKVESWRKALFEASNISGWETNQIANGHEAQGIKQIVNIILLSLKPVTSVANEKMIGMRNRVQALKTELQIESGGVRMVGIWGVGGGGKTTLTSFVYDEISHTFDGCCFLNNIREESSKNGLEKLQENILKGVFKQKEVEVGRIDEGRQMIKARLHHKKVLIVLDDVDHLDQLKALVGSHVWFGNGSRIIITTRDEHLLKAHRVDVIHHISLLNNDEAIKLFRKHAHGDFTPMEEDFEKLSKEVVSYAGGLPLALTVLGAFLCDKNVSQWRSALARLKEIPHKDIIGILRISFDGLEEIEKNLFLDIACLFRRKHTIKAMELFEACGLHPVIGVKVLRQKALITITYDGRFDMHDLVQEMGHYIVRGEHPKNPEKHSRVWKWEDVLRILAMDPKTEMKLDNIEAIHLPGQDSYEEKKRFLQVAGNMKKLRWIDCRCSRRNSEQRDEKNVVPLPENFPPPQLCYLYLQSCIPQKQLWEGYKHLPNLTRMELVNMSNLIKIPNFAGLPNLETFKLYDCPYLEEVHPSIGRLESLVFLSIECCPRLRKFPSITRIKKLVTLKIILCKKLRIMSEIQQRDNLPHLYLDDGGKEVASCSSSPPPGVECYLPHNNMKRRGLCFIHSALRSLDLWNCSLGDEEIGSDVWDLPNLEELSLFRNPLISRLDFSILRLPRLKRLFVLYCRSLVELSELPSTIVVVIANGCESLESLGDISNCKWLWNVSLYENNKLDQHHVDTLIHSMLQGNAIEKDYFISVVLGKHKLPSRFVGRLFRGDTFKLQLPDDWYNDFCGFLICIVTNMKYPSVNISIKQEEPPIDLSQEPDEAMNPIYYYGKMTFIKYVSFSSLRHTTTLSSSCNIISFTMKDQGYFRADSFHGGIELIPRKSKSDEVQTTDCSGFWDKKSEDEDYVNIFTIHQSDSESSIQISWRPY